MKRLSKKLLLLAATLATSLNSLTTLEAGCHGSSGRRVYSSHHHISRSVYSRPHDSHEVISYARPVYVHAQPEVVYESSPHTISPLSSSPFGVQVQQGTAVGTTPVSLAQPVQWSQNGLSQPSVSQQTLQQQSFPDQTGLPQIAPQQFGNAGARTNFADSPSPVTQGASAATSAEATTAAELSALQALGGFAPSQAEITAAAPQTQSVPDTTPAHIGTWTASMSNGARVQLTLSPDGRFTWSAINSAGSASTFQGGYAFDGTALTLSRSSDNQKLAGALTFTSAGTFNFKLSDAQAGSLAFTRR